MTKNRFKGSGEGYFRRACGKQYFFSKIDKNRNEAETECCKYGMKLLSIESYDELNCLAEMNSGITRYNSICHAHSDAQTIF
jgi:hypothetical protein